MRKTFRIAAIILILGLGAYRVYEYSLRQPSAGSLVSKIIDGDTVELKGGERVRLLAIDAPEEGEPYADSAKIMLANLILGKMVRLTHDFQKRDHYDRLLAYIYIDTILVNAALVNAGYARLYLYPDNMQNNTDLPLIFAAQRAAMENVAGVWSLPVKTEEYYVGNSRSLRFHRPFCESATKIKDENKVIFSNRDEAFYQGYAACRNCKP